MEKAKLLIYGENGSCKTVPVLFNPEEYSLSRAVNYAVLEAPGLDSPIVQYINGKQTELKLTLHFDTQNDYIPKDSPADVRAHTAPIADALWIDGKLHTPPVVAFSWGSFFFRGVITQLSQSFTMFLPSGLPVRSKMELTFAHVPDNREIRKKSPFESPDRTRARYAEPCSALWRMAHEEYGDAAFWRYIAAANQIYNPRRYPAGRLLKLPPLDFSRGRP